MVGESKRSLRSDIDVSTLYSMREQGMTYKQIAQKVGCSTSTVYEYIGRKGESVAQIKRDSKPVMLPLPPEPPKVTPIKVEAPKLATTAKPETSAPETSASETPTTETPAPPELSKKSILTVLKEVRILDLEGALCNYHVNPLTGDVEFSSGVISGLLDRSALAVFRKELDEISKLLGGENA